MTQNRSGYWDTNAIMSIIRLIFKMKLLASKKVSILTRVPLELWALPRQWKIHFHGDARALNLCMRDLSRNHASLISKHDTRIERGTRVL
ncbi:hypothetical protein B6D51_28965 [Pseudomonas chlororaphis subsp. chlororaphis]|nr:hypothetical protein B6D51_28965 [Pseudomonas chlororaphis subsp. chlororaphis]